MSKEAMKLALGKIKSARVCHFAAIDTLLFEAEEILEEALAEQPYEIGTRLAREGKGISDLWGAVKSDADMAEAQRGYEAALAEQPAPGDIRALKHRIHQLEGDVIGYKQMLDAAEQPAHQETVAWMEMVVANLVREGVNKHKARELAQHFHTSPPAQQDIPDLIAGALGVSRGTAYDMMRESLEKNK